MQGDVFLPTLFTVLFIGLSQVAAENIRGEEHTLGRPGEQLNLLVVIPNWGSHLSPKSGRFFFTTDTQYRVNIAAFQSPYKTLPLTCH